MNKKTLNDIFAGVLFRVPDYQRGYAWEEKQLKDFIQDLDALVDENVRSHYTGTLVAYGGRDAPEQRYRTDLLRVLDVVDGQQRLTTACLYLSVILRALVDRGQKEYEHKVADFLYSGATCRLALNNETADLFYDLLKTGQAKTAPQSPHGKRLVAALDYLKGHIDTQLKRRGDQGLAYLEALCGAFVRKLHFTYYEIEEECEVGMTFELMNARGKKLSVLELLKNYLMHWVSRNADEDGERNSLTALINKDWKACYANLGASDGKEDQCLWIAWTLICNHSPKNWKGYEGFKDDAYIPLRDFSVRSKAETKKFIADFVEGLAEVSSHYASIIDPTPENTLSTDELEWLTKILRTGNITNFLPILVAARIKRRTGAVSAADYIDLLVSLERYAYRVFLTEGKRSNAGKSALFKWGARVFRNVTDVPSVTYSVYHLLRHHASEEKFRADLSEPSVWYGSRRLRYTLFEYELHLLATEGKGKQPHLRWEDLTKESTIEHILPGTPKEQSHWLEVWSADEIKVHLNDIGNLVLTQNNSNYLNFEFDRKKGKPGLSPSYANSDIRQERKIASYPDWTPSACKQRRNELVSWIKERWGTEAMIGDLPAGAVDEDDDEDDCVETV